VCPTLEECTGVFGRTLRQRLRDRSLQQLACAGAHTPQRILDVANASSIGEKSGE
jgi:hypothetical protein